MLECSIPRYSRKAYDLNFDTEEFIRREMAQRGKIEFYPSEEVEANADLSLYPRFLHPLKGQTYTYAVIHTIEYKKGQVLLHGIATGDHHPLAVSTELSRLVTHDLLHLADYFSTFINFLNMLATRQTFTYDVMQQNPADYPLLTMFEEKEQILNAYIYQDTVYVVEYLKDKSTDTVPTFIVLTDWMQPQCTTLRKAEEAGFELMAERLVDDFEEKEEPAACPPPPTPAETLMKTLLDKYTTP